MKNLTDFRKTVETGMDPRLLSRVNVYRNDLKLFRVSGRFELSRARVTESKIIVNV